MLKIHGGLVHCYAYGLIDERPFLVPQQRLDQKRAQATLSVDFSLNTLYFS
ncbi:hypothetical protein SAMN05444355_107220 [Flavobacterium frigoris]|uniref:Uncharacterized protein n=1 Tax=Flavobacterium frigoris TaxID=229204 RepID=A0A1H9M2A4_FLAFI|nr:hypothetical protein SAMN05444355_107220 [Flavobacterium frigoris]